MNARAQYALFLVNGGLLGLVAIVLQRAIFFTLGLESGLNYAAASALTYVPLIIANFIIQRRFIFASQGRFLRFLVANFAVMLLVSVVSPICRLLLAVTFWYEVGDIGGFVLAALIMATPSFLLMKYWVFRD